MYTLITHSAPVISLPWLKQKLQIKFVMEKKKSSAGSPNSYCRCCKATLRVLYGSLFPQNIYFIYRGRKALKARFYHSCCFVLFDLQTHGKITNWPVLTLTWRGVFHNYCDNCWKFVKIGWYLSMVSIHLFLQQNSFFPGSKDVWLPTPSWGNHTPILKYVCWSR